MKPLTKAALIFAFVTACWIIMVVHGTLGFMRPVDAHTIVGDFVHLFVWILFLYCGWNLISAVRARNS